MGVLSPPSPFTVSQAEMDLTDRGHDATLKITALLYSVCVCVRVYVCVCVGAKEEIQTL